MVQETEQIGIESLIDKLFDRLGYVAEIYVAHLPSASEVAQLHITVHTGEADSLEQSLDLTTADEVAVDTGEAEPLSVPFDVMATVDGAGHPQGTEGTTVYIDDSVVWSEKRERETGVEMLRSKLAGTCPICETAVDGLGSHLRANRGCARAERM